jgi:tetratricopeptide (TPR) repeat protein
LGSSHPAHAIALRDLGLVLQRKGNFAEAEGLFRESLAIAEASLGDEHPQVADLLNRLASVRGWQKDLAAADSIHRLSVALNRKIYGERHLEYAYALNNLASVLRDEEGFEEADSLHLKALEISRSVVGEDHSAYWILLGNRGMTLRAMGNCDIGESVLRDAIDGIRRTIPNNVSRAPAVQRWLGACLMDRGRFEEAESELLASLSDLRAFHGDSHSITQDAAQLLVTLYTRWDKPEQARPYQALIDASK